MVALGGKGNIGYNWIIILILMNVPDEKENDSKL
jgi:hypothetical protein